MARRRARCRRGRRTSLPRAGLESLREEGVPELAEQALLQQRLQQALSLLHGLAPGLGLFAELPSRQKSRLADRDVAAALPSGRGLAEQPVSPHTHRQRRPQ